MCIVTFLQRFFKTLGAKYLTSKKTCKSLIKRGSMIEPTSPHSRPDRLLRKPSVLAMLGISHGALYDGIKNGRYPKGYKLSPRVTVWKESEIQAVIDSLTHDLKD